MSDKYHDELENLKDELLKFGYFSTGMFRDSLKALYEQDVVLAEEANRKKSELSSKSDEIEERSLRLVALYQPMGADLRTIACINRMNESLFRIGRYGKDIAILVEGLSETQHLRIISSISHMTDYVLRMIEDVLSAFEASEISYISDLSERDNYVDDQRYAIFRESLTYIMEDAENITPCIDYIMVSRYLERCGDHACLMAEKVHFMVTGERVMIK